jgi:hypothetical protein
VTLFVGGTGVFITGLVTGVWAALTGLCALLGLGVLAAAPAVSQTLLAAGEPRLVFRQYLASLVVLAFYWIGAGIAFVLFLKAFPTLELAASNIESASIYVFSWGIGFVTLFAPQGIGVSELVASNLLGERGSVAALAALLAGFRVVILTADLTAWLLAMFSRGCVRPLSFIIAESSPPEL